MAAVEIYTTPICPFCIRAKNLLKRKGVEFTEYGVMTDRAKRAEMEQRAGRHTVPQIFIDGSHVGGCDDLYELEASGRLDTLLGTVPA